MAQTEGMAGLPFANDIIDHLKDNWTSNGGTQPIMTTKWKKKAVGVGSRNYEEIIVSIDSENPRLYSMISGIGSDGKFDYDWMHDISLTLDIYSSTSEERVLQIVDEILRILKNNVVSTINTREYIQIIPTNIVSLNEEFRNIFRYSMDVDAMRINP